MPGPKTLRGRMGHRRTAYLRSMKPRRRLMPRPPAGGVTLLPFDDDDFSVSGRSVGPAGFHGRGFHGRGGVPGS